MKANYRRRIFVAATLLICAGSTSAQITFTDVTTAAGVAHTGETFGVSWGDFDGDGFPDVWVGNHSQTPNLFINQGDGTFTDIAGTPALPPMMGPTIDAHGAAWADFDNDGDQDLIEVTGSLQDNRLYVNESGVLTNQAMPMGIPGVALNGSRSRTPTWVDYDRDGTLDLLLAHALGPTEIPVVLKGSLTQFDDATMAVGLTDTDFAATYLADITGDGVGEIFFSDGNPNGGPVFDASAAVWSDLTAAGSTLTFPADVGCADTILADFNGDGETDIFASCGGGGREVVQSGNVVEVQFSAINEQIAVEFDYPAEITIDVFPGFVFDTNVTMGNLAVGDSGFQPAIDPPPQPALEAFSITLDPADPNIFGDAVLPAGSTRALLVSYDDATGHWRVAFETDLGAGVAVVITGNDAGETVSNLITDGFPATPTGTDPIYLVRSGAEFIDDSTNAGLNTPLPCTSNVGGDFDNDMDIDIYLVCSLTITNQNNVLLINDGSGVFTAAPLMAGLGSLEGSGDSVAAADYDNDGFLDLFVTNGRGSIPFNDGPHQLFQNDGNANSWIQITLLGSTSNADAIGSTVTVTANGITQSRMITGGTHRRSQDFNRAHFGLAANTVVDSLDVNWISGATTSFTNVAVNQILNINEDGSSDIDGDGVNDIDDAFPSDGSESVDTDGDGTGNNADTDDDGDGITDADEITHMLDPLDASDATQDADGDGVDNITEIQNGQDPNDPSDNQPPAPPPSGGGGGGGSADPGSLVLMLLLGHLMLSRRRSRARRS